MTLAIFHSSALEKNPDMQKSPSVSKSCFPHVFLSMKTEGYIYN